MRAFRVATQLHFLPRRQTFKNLALQLTRVRFEFLQFVLQLGIGTLRRLFTHARDATLEFDQRSFEVEVRHDPRFYSLPVARNTSKIASGWPLPLTLTGSSRRKS